LAPVRADWHVGATHDYELHVSNGLTPGLSYDTMLPPTLWHYTNRAGLWGILTSRSLWATRCLRLDDPREFRFAGDVMGSVLDDLIDAETSPEVRPALETLQRLVSTADPRVTPDLYICSFTASGDNRDIWRLHTRPPDAYNLGFDGMYLWMLGMRSWQLRKCLYMDHEQRAMIFYALNHRLDELKSGDHFARTLPVLINDIAWLAPILKRPEFEIEQEWRMIHYPPWLVRFPDDVPSTVYITPKRIPYVVFPFDDSLPRIPITLGPGPALRPDENDIIARAAASRIIATTRRSTIALRELV